MKANFNMNLMEKLNFVVPWQMKQYEQKEDLFYPRKKEGSKEEESAMELEELEQ